MTTIVSIDHVKQTAIVDTSVRIGSISLGLETGELSFAEAEAAQNRTIEEVEAGGWRKLTFHRSPHGSWVAMDGSCEAWFTKNVEAGAVYYTKIEDVFGIPRPTKMFRVWEFDAPDPSSLAGILADAMARQRFSTQR